MRVNSYVDPAFNEDEFIQARVKELLQKHQIKIAIETGTYEGATTLFLAQLVPQVYTVDVVPSAVAKHKFKTQPNITAVLNRSPEALEYLILRLPQEKIFFYLDAHVPENPLLEELGVIAKLCKDRAVIAIHDFKAPDKPWLYYEQLSLEYISRFLPELWPHGFTYSFNDQVGKANIGCVFIEPAPSNVSFSFVPEPAEVWC